MTAHEMPALRGRVAVSTLIGVGAASLCFLVMHRLHQGAGDFIWAVHLAQRVLAHRNPYDTPFEQYPLTAGLLAMPFVRLAPEVAAGVFYGLSSGLLALGLTRQGYHRLFVFLAYPFWAGLLTVQWATATMVGAFFPVLAGLTMAKPQIGLPVLLSRFRRVGFWSCAVVGLASLAIMPRWPQLWIAQMGNYQHFFPILVLPGPLLLLALWRYRDRDAWLLFLMACMPQRWFFDAFVLWLIPRTRREILVTVFFSWCSGLWRYYHGPTSFTQAGRWIVLSIYLPMLAIVLLRRREAGD